MYVVIVVVAWVPLNSACLPLPLMMMPCCAASFGCVAVATPKTERDQRGTHENETQTQTHTHTNTCRTQHSLVYFAAQPERTLCFLTPYLLCLVLHFCGITVDLADGG